MVKTFNKNKFKRNLSRYKNRNSSYSDGFYNCVEIVTGQDPVESIDFDSFTMEDLSQVEQYICSLTPASFEEFASQNAGNILYEQFRMAYVHDCLTKSKYKSYPVTDDFI